MTVEPPGAALSTGATLLVATDFSDHAERATEVAIALARKLGANVVLLHTHEIPVYAVPDATLVAPEVYAAGMAHTAQTRLDAIVARHATSGVSLRTLLREGPCASTIDAVADELDAEIVVVGTHGRTGLARALLGSVAERILRTVHRPVLAVPPPKSAPTTP